MDLSGWLLYALLTMAALAMVTYLYGRREVPGRGRHILAGLRWAAIAVLLLLLFDPDLSPPGLTSSDRVQVILDGSLSMSVPLGEGESLTRWDAAISEARRVAGASEVLIFGDRLTTISADSLGEVRPQAPRSLLAPALRAAAEGGARRVVIMTDGGIEDLAEVDRLLPLLGMEIEVWEPGGEPLVNRSITELDAPIWAEAEKPLEVRVGVSVDGQAGDLIGVVIREGDEVIARDRIESPGPGRVGVSTLEFSPVAPDGGGIVRYDIELEGSDPIPDDDRRSLYLFVDEKPTGVALVSFRPDWEPRFLYPVLEEALGLPVRGYIQVDGERYLSLGAGGEAGAPIAEPEVRRALSRAHIVVLHGYTDELPAWVRDLASEGRRVLLFPASGTVSGLPARLPAPVAGDWYMVSELPRSPIAEHLTGLPLANLPPLGPVRPITLPEGAWSPLTVSRQRGSGAGTPLIAGFEDEGRRMVVTLGTGFWRWALRGGSSRDSYRRLWSAVGGWLLEDERMLDPGPLRPLERVIARGALPRWVISAGERGEDSRIALQVSNTAGEVALDTVLYQPLLGDTISMPVLEPGHYHYLARVGGEGAGVEGEFTVESYSAEYQRAPVALDSISAMAKAGSTPLSRRTPARPLHTEPWPYLAFVLLVSTEWIFRRRWGLR